LHNDLAGDGGKGLFACILDYLIKVGIALGFCAGSAAAFFSAPWPCAKAACIKLERVCPTRCLSERNLHISSRNSLKQRFTMLRFTLAEEAVWGGVYVLCKAAENSVVSQFEILNADFFKRGFKWPKI